MLVKNEERIGIVSAIGSNGEGIIKDEGNVVFIPYSFIGEKVKYKVLKSSSKCTFAKLIQVIEKSPDRVAPICPVFEKCGGCQLQHIDYTTQLLIKKENIKSTFKKISFLEINVKDVVCGENVFRYRNKLQLPVSQKKNKTFIGFFAEGSHRVVPITDCYINAEWTKILISSLLEYMKKFSLTGYDESIKKGDIREITAKEINGNLIITLVITGQSLIGLSEFVDILKKNLNKDFSLYINTNNSDSNTIFGEEFKLIYGLGEYYGEMLGIQFPMGVRSFMQVNTDICEKLYLCVKETIKKNKKNYVIDAYSGAGLMTAIIAKEVKKAIGIEIVNEAVCLANSLAKENGLNNMVNYNGKCEEVLPAILNEDISSLSDYCIVLDPPRKGCDLRVLSAIKKSNIDLIIYVSCNPSTLARDVGLLTGTLIQEDNRILKSNSEKLDYVVTDVIPFDMFPHTKHVETLCVLTRKIHNL